MTHWLHESSIGMSGAADREATAIDRVNTLVASVFGGYSGDTLAQTITAPLPPRWQLDRDMLSIPLQDKLAARTDAGLGNPVHAHGAHQIAALTEAEWHARATQAHRHPHKAGLLDPLGGKLSAEQERELITQLPFDGPATNGPALDAALAPFRILHHRNTVHLPGWGALSLPAAGLTAVLGVAIIVGLTPAVVLALLLAAAATAAERRDARPLKLTGTDYAQLAAATHRAPDPTPGSPEDLLAHLASELATAITACPAWQSPFLENHRLRLDPVTEAAAIAAHAAQISELTRDLGPAPTGTSTTARQARERRNADDRALAIVYQSLTRRVAALYRYAAELHDLNLEYEALQAVERSMAVNPRLENLVRQTGADELAAAHLAGLADEAEILRAAIAAHLQVLAGDLTALS